MIVRESPKSKVATRPQNWPPRSPHEALLSSPSGRKKYERQQRNSISPSPSKRRPLSRALLDEGVKNDEDEDEETLQLQLAEIQARLKLKKLQKAKQTAEDADSGSTRAPSRPGTAPGLRRVELPRPEPDVQVPVSPVRHRRAVDEQTSPARVRLGIDKGLKAQDVSLKRATSFSSRLQSATSGTLSRASSTRAAEAPKGKSFSERIAESRNKDREDQEKHTRIENSRTHGFNLKNIPGLRDGTASRSGSSLSSGTRGSQEQASQKSTGLTSSRSTGDLRGTSMPRPSSGFSARSGSSRAPSAASQAPSENVKSSAFERYARIADLDNSSEAASFESFSSLHLKTREMEHTTLTRTLDGKSIFTIPQLLKTVRGPNYDPPDMENDFVVMGIICAKSGALDTKLKNRDQSTNKSDTNANNNSRKFMVLRLTDLKYEIELFLFDTGFESFWKLPEGTLIAVLNPDVMPPKNRDTGKFSLKLASSDDTILEVGTSRDLDFCHSIKKDGKQCTQWIDSRKTEHCNFHIELQVEKSKRGRMEVNTMTGFGKGPGGGRHGMFGGGGTGRAGNSKGDQQLKREGKFHDKYLHETMYITPTAGAAARLLDEENSGFERGGSRAEQHRKRLADQERERELAKKLGQIGTGAGGDYMRVKAAADPANPNLPLLGDTSAKEVSTQAQPEDRLGLLGKKADDVHLSPVKRKRIPSSSTSGPSIISSKTLLAHTREPIGWGGAYKRGLLLPPNSPTKQSSFRTERENSPAKKKARLLLPEKGIREPGRDSLGGLDVGLLAAMDEDDDLEIV